VSGSMFVKIRTAVLFIGGLIGVAYVTLTDQTDRPTLLILFAAMMGLPLFLHTDEKLHEHVELPPPKHAADDDEPSR
jgi:hypothetical protein